MLGSYRFAIMASIAVTLLLVACSSDSNPEPRLTTTAVSTTLPTTGGRAIPTLAPDLPSTPSAPPPEETTETPTLTAPNPGTSAPEPIVRVAPAPTVRVAPAAPTALPIQPATPLPPATPRVAAAARPSITSVTSP